MATSDFGLVTAMLWQLTGAPASEVPADLRRTGGAWATCVFDEVAKPSPPNEPAAGVADAAFGLCSDLEHAFQRALAAPYGEDDAARRITETRSAMKEAALV